MKATPPRRPSTDGRVARGEVTRDAILVTAADIASVEGLEGLSIGRLASELGLSKSGVFAHFGSKEDLQVAVVGKAVEIFTERVTARALEVPAGIGRVWAVASAWLDYSRRRTFPGGCFFRSAASDFSSRPGAVRDAVARAQEAWMAFYEATIAEAQRAGEVLPDVDPGQLAFELDAVAMLADLRAQLFESAQPYDLAAHAVLTRLQGVAVEPGMLPSGPS